MPKPAVSLLALLAVGGSPAALAADPPGTETATYDYELIHVRLDEGLSPQQFSGALFMGDVTAGSTRHPSSSEFRVVINESNVGTIVDCQLGLGGPTNDDIVQVGSFAQQAEGDVDALLHEP